jgi:hypothetical protein
VGAVADRERVGGGEVSKTVSDGRATLHGMNTTRRVVLDEDVPEFHRLHEMLDSGFRRAEMWGVLWAFLATAGVVGIAMLVGLGTGYTNEFVIVASVAVYGVLLGGLMIVAVKFGKRRRAAKRRLTALRARATQRYAELDREAALEEERWRNSNDVLYEPRYYPRRSYRPSYPGRGSRRR